jgi:hypothetical protein
VLYDGWRQLYFIYPPFVLLCIYGFNFLFEKDLGKLIAIGSFAAFISSGFFMVNNHPFQHVYFNKFIDTRSPEHLRKQFELDYWGTSYKQSLEYILEHDQSPSINVSVQNSPGRDNREILTFEERKRINIVGSPRNRGLTGKLENATYFITNYRWHPEDYEDLEQAKWHSIKVGNNTINAIFKLR